MICYYVLNLRNLRQIEISEINDLLVLLEADIERLGNLRSHINSGFDLDQVYWVDAETALIVTEYANPTAISKLATNVQYETYTRMLNLQSKQRILEIDTQVLIAETNGQLSLDI
jgi:hypothetical protein